MFTVDEEAQLQKRKEEYMSGWQQCLESVRASLRDYPNGGGDIEIMAEVDQLIKKAQKTEKEIQELSNATPDTDKFYCLDCGCQCAGEFWVGKTDARRLCSLCKADRSRREQVTEKTPEVQFTFTHATLMTFMEGIMALALAQANKKNKDYASVIGSANTGLANFYETDRRYGGTPMRALATHRLKHELAIEMMLRGEELHSEPIMGRIIDAINYNVLALALYIETKQDVELLNKAADEMAALGISLGTTNYQTANNK